jgi:uncharacterized protein (TIGR03083 family)
MSPGLQAAADRYLADGGYVLYLAGCLAEDDLDRRPPQGDWTVRQVLAHLGAATERAAGHVERVVADGPLLPEGFDTEAVNHGDVSSAAGLDLAALAERIRAGRVRVLQALANVDEAHEAQVHAGWTLLSVITGWSLHYQHHALDLMEAVPRLADDPLVALWVFGGDYDDPRLRNRQRALLKGVRQRSKTKERGPRNG